MRNKPITMDYKNNVKKWAKTSILTIKLSIFKNNSKSRHQIKKVRPYLESRHQNTSSYVVKNEKSIVNMLIVDMRRCEKYTNTHENSFHTSKESRGTLASIGEWPWRASRAQHEHQFSFRLLPGDLGFIHYYRARPED